jgi:two-component system sensor histidine kinase VanS
MLILLLVIGGMYLLFSNQIRTTIETTQQRQTSEVFLPLLEQLREKTDEEVVAFAEEFHDRNSSFDFTFITEDGEVLYQTDNFEIQSRNNTLSGNNMRLSDNMLTGGNYLISLGSQNTDRMIFLTGNENGLRLYVASAFSGTSVHREMLQRTAWMFALILLISTLAALLFARRIAVPIQKVSEDTKAMSLLLPVDPPRERSDEIGKLSKDVYAMYDRLKSTIHQLETEVENVKQMEESQRYFFSAASHELKTPIAAIGAIIEGMQSEVITPEEYPSYLREGMKLINEQNRLITEILELVKFSGDVPVQDKKPICLLKCINGALDSIYPLIESKNQLLTVDVDENIVCELSSGLISKALSNVLLNATQNSPKGSEIRIAAKAETNTMLTIWNSDAEIPENLLKRICEPFYRADEARTSGEGRSGLGLTIVKKALDLMGICFVIKNSGGGVLFQMEIPS